VFGVQMGRGPFAPAATGLVKIGEVMTLVVSVEGDPAFDIQVKHMLFDIQVKRTLFDIQVMRTLFDIQVKHTLFDIQVKHTLFDIQVMHTVFDIQVMRMSRASHLFLLSGKYKVLDL
jgi:hypothetical protein